jgi:hypothetical protein
MVTLASFSNMLNEYLYYEMLFEEMQRRNYLLQKVTKDTNWKGGTLPVPFEGNMATSYAFGQLTADTDIHEYQYVRGTVSGYKEVWGSMIWQAKDLVEHVPEAARQKGYINKQSFLKNIHYQLKKFVEGMEDAVSITLLSGSAFAKLTADATANDGVILVNRINRFSIGQKVIVQDALASVLTGYVKSIDVNNSKVVLVTTRGGSTVLNFAGTNMTLANSASCYYDNAQTSGTTFTSLRSQLLSAANGGTSTLFGQSKLAYPHLQSVNVSGATVSSTNILDKIFDAWTTIKNIGKGNATDVLFSYKHLGSVMKLLEAGAGAYRHVSTKVSPFGYTEITLTGVKGDLLLVGIQEMDDDLIYFMDWDAVTLHSNGYFEKHADPEGKSYFVKRNTTGYQYIVDIRFYGELVCHHPSHCGVMYGVNY